MGTEYGQKIAGALKAIITLHSDTSKLLCDCDKHIGKDRDSVFANYATRDLTYHVRASFWMAEGVYRYYDAGPRLVDGVTVTFFNREAETEPLLKIARIQYSDTSPANGSDSKDEGLRAFCKEWDIWSLFFRFTEERRLGEILTFADADNGRIAWARLIAVPLFSIGRIEDVIELVGRVVESAPKARVVTP